MTFVPTRSRLATSEWLEAFWPLNHISPPSSNRYCSQACSGRVSSSNSLRNNMVKCSTRSRVQKIHLASQFSTASSRRVSVTSSKAMVVLAENSMAMRRQHSKGRRLSR